MSSMDELHERMQYFNIALQRFQDSLEVSLTDLRSRHETVDPHWQDEARRHYEIQYEPLREMLHRYVTQQGPDYLQFVQEKIRCIDRYLHG